jgi:hypothetical protein
MVFAASMLELLQRFGKAPQPVPPAAKPPSFELVVTLAHILACVTLFVCARVLRTLSQLRVAERAHADAIKRRRASAPTTLALGAGGARCWSESMCQAESETTASGSDSSPTPTESDVDPVTPLAEQSGALSLALLLQSERPVVELAFLRRIASKPPPLCVPFASAVARAWARPAASPGASFSRARARGSLRVRLS